MQTSLPSGVSDEFPIDVWKKINVSSIMHTREYLTTILLRTLSATSWESAPPGSGKLEQSPGL